MNSKLKIIKDKNKCTNCKLCELNCILIKWLGFSTLEKANLDYCNKCGHCIASCNYEALDHPLLNEKKIIKIKNIPSNEEALNLFYYRRTWRAFKNEPIKKEHLEILFEAVKYSETAHNDQDVNIVFIKSKELLNKIADASMDFHEKIKKMMDDEIGYKKLEKIMGKDAIIFFKKQFQEIERQTDFRKKGNNYGTYNATGIMLFTSKEGESSKLNSLLAAQSVTLLAPTLGIGTCFKGTLIAAYNNNEETFVNLLKDLIPKGDDKIYACLLMGYEKYKYKKAPPRKERQIIIV